MNWRLDLIRQICSLSEPSKKFLSLIRFANNLYTLYNQLNASRLPRFRKKKHENMWIRKTQCWALFLISKATFTKAAIKSKFDVRFALKNSSAAIDQCTIKLPNFVSIENFFKLSNVGAKLSKHWSYVIDLAKFLLWDFLSSRV